MRLLLHWSVIGLCLAPFFHARAEDPSYSRTYRILIRGTPAGKEVVRETLDKNGNLVSSSESEILVSDGLETKRLSFVTELVLSKTTLAPIRYSYRYTSGDTKDGFVVSVKNGEITRVLNRGGHTSETTTPLKPDMVILDFNVYHQYDFLIRKYDLKKGGRQSFSNFIPLIGGEIPLAVTRLEDSNLEHARGSLPVRNFKIEFVGIWTGTFSTDKEGRLVRLVVRDQDLEVVQEDLLKN